MDLRQRILAFIKKFIDQNRYPPTRKEIGEEFGISKSHVQYHLRKLSDMGFIDLVPNVARGIHLIDQDNETLRSKL